MGTSSDLKGIDQIGESIEKQDQLDEKDKAFSSNQPELKYKISEDKDQNKDAVGDKEVEGNLSNEGKLIILNNVD